MKVKRCDPGRTRTANLILRTDLLFQLSYRTIMILKRRECKKNFHHGKTRSDYIAITV